MKPTTSDRFFVFHLCASLVLAPTVPLVAAESPCRADLSGPGGDPDGVVSSQDLAVLLTQWGPCTACSADIDSDGVVGSRDLAEILTSWGPCEGSVVEVDLDKVPVVVDLPQPMFDELEPTFSGSIQFNLAVGEAEGTTEVSLAPDLATKITFPGAGPASALSDRVLVQFPEVDDGPFLVDGIPVTLGTVVDVVHGDLTSDADPATWSPLTRSVVSLGVLTASDVWGDVFQSSSVGSSNRNLARGVCSPSWLCRHTAIALGVLIATPIAAACVVIAGACVPGTALTFGWAAVPCVVVTLLCGLAATEIATVMQEWFISRCTECRPFTGACCIPYSTPTGGCEWNGDIGFLGQTWDCAEMSERLCELARDAAGSRGCVYPIGSTGDEMLFYYPGTPCSQISCGDWGVCCASQNQVYLTTRDECEQSSNGYYFFPVDPSNPASIGAAFLQAFVCFDAPFRTDSGRSSAASSN